MRYVDLDGMEAVVRSRLCPEVDPTAGKVAIDKGLAQAVQRVVGAGIVPGDRTGPAGRSCQGRHGARAKLFLI
jgi:hypothetical protein